MRAYDVRVLPADEASAPAPVIRRRLGATLSAPADRVGSLPSVREGRAGRDPRSLGERTAPRSTDARLWRAPLAVELPLDDHAVARMPITAAVGALNDSIAAVKEARRAAADWTLVGEDGSRWGASFDTVHVGGLSFSLRSCSAGPCDGYWLQAPPGRREEMAERRRSFDDIRRQAAQAELEQSIVARIRAIRIRTAVGTDSLPGGDAAG